MTNNTKFSDELFQAIKDNDENITTLELFGHDIGGKGAEELADALKVNSTLRWLYLNNNNIGDKGAEALADALKVNTTLRWLYLWENNIGDKGAEELAKAKSYRASINNTIHLIF